MPKNHKNYINSSLDSSLYLSQKLYDKFGSEYVKNRVTQVSLVNKLIKVPSIQYFPLRPTCKNGYPSCPNAWKSSTYHLLYPLRTKIIKLPPFFYYN